MAGRKTIDRWIAEILLDPNQESPCTHIACFHRVGGSVQEVFSQKLGEDKGDPKRLADLFLGKAENHINDQPGSQLFYLRAFYGTNEHQQQYSFRVDGGSDLGHGETEPATKEGALSQAMRQSEAGFRFFHTQCAALVTQQHVLLETTMKRLAAVQEENFDAMKLVKEVMLAQVTSQHELRMKEIQYTENMKLANKVMQFAPALVNAATGQEVFPQSTADTAMLETLFENVSQEQIKLLGNFIPAEIMGPLADRAAKYHEEKEKAEQAAIKVLTSGSGHGTGKTANN